MRFLMDWAQEQGLAGMLSEATTAHPYSHRPNVELGGHQTGFLPGWIPAGVAIKLVSNTRFDSELADGT
jgi:hypothetical protein